jgi:transcriptional regulator with XRE-family HTH domain
MSGQAQHPNAEAPAGMDHPLQLPRAMTSPLIAPGGEAVAEQPALNFGSLLRQLRTEARLTQEELAEAARLSPRSVSDLERGISRTARKDTAGLLADALSLTGPARELFVAAGRGRVPTAQVLAARGGTAPGAFAAAVTEALPHDLASLAVCQAELEHFLRALTRAVADGVVIVVIHAALDPARPIPAGPAHPTPRSSYTAASARSGHFHRTRKRRPGFTP